jgi:hypothetical protein
MHALTQCLTTLVHNAMTLKHKTRHNMIYIFPITLRHHTVFQIVSAMLTPTANSSDSQARPWAELMHSTQQTINVLDDAQTVQDAWNDGESAPASTPQITTEDHADESSASSASSASSSSSTSDVQETEPTEADEDEEFRDFVCESTDPLKQPVYSSYLPDEDQTLELPNVNSAPEWQTGIFVGHGLIEPVRASLDTSTRSLRRAGKLALRKLQIMREKKILDARERAPHLFQATQEDVEEPTEAIVHDKPANEYLPQATHIILKHPLDGIVRPVSFAQVSSTNQQQFADINKVIEDERSVRG